MVDSIHISDRYTGFEIPSIIIIYVGMGQALLIPTMADAMIICQNSIISGRRTSY